MQYREGHEACDKTIAKQREEIAELKRRNCSLQIELRTTTIDWMKTKIELFTIRRAEDQAQLAELEKAEEPRC